MKMSDKVQDFLRTEVDPSPGPNQNKPFFPLEVIEFVQEDIQLSLEDEEKGGDIAFLNELLSSLMEDVIDDEMYMKYPPLFMDKLFCFITYVCNHLRYNLSLKAGIQLVGFQYPEEVKTDESV